MQRCTKLIERFEVSHKNISKTRHASGVEVQYFMMSDISKIYTVLFHLFAKCRLLGFFSGFFVLAIGYYRNGLGWNLVFNQSHCAVLVC